MSRWLLLVHQLPATPSNLRVRTWRRLQQLGAIPIKQAVYVLPDSPASREDFEWLKTEIKGAGGDASIFAADHVDAWSDDELIEAFRRTRQEAYATLARDAERTLRKATAGRTRRRVTPMLRRAVEAHRQRFGAIQHIDFFGSAGRDAVALLLKQLDDALADAPAPRSSDSTTPRDYRGQLWVTRPRPGVDRMASAWLVRRSIDPAATFGFARDVDAVPDGAVPFDMFGAEFSHQGANCTFETLCERFHLDDPAVARIAAIVHDLDLKDGRFGAPENDAIATIITGLQLTHASDAELLASGMALFDALYRGFDQSLRAAAPPAAARARRSSRSNARGRSSRRARR